MSKSLRSNAINVDNLKHEDDTRLDILTACPRHRFSTGDSFSPHTSRRLTSLPSYEFSSIHSPIFRSPNLRPSCWRPPARGEAYPLNCGKAEASVLSCPHWSSETRAAHIYIYIYRAEPGTSILVAFFFLLYQTSASIPPSSITSA